MRLTGTNLVRLGVVHAVGVAALAFAMPAHATDDPPPPGTSAAAFVLTSHLPDEMTPDVASAADATTSLVNQESPGNTPPSAPATAQLDAVRQGWSQVISPTHAQKSPERASTSETQRSAVATPPDKPQYHPRHVQYQRLSTASSKTRAPVLPTASFSSRELTRITRSVWSIGSPNRSVNEAFNCTSDPDGNWPLALPADDSATLQCTPGPLADEETVDDPSDSAGCADPEAQYQPDEPQYQTPASTPCGASGDSVVPISEPAAPVASTPGSSDAPAPTSVVSPTTEPVATAVPSDTASTRPGADVLPPPAGPPPATTKVAGSGFVARPSRPRLSRPRQQAPTERVIPVQVPSVSPSATARRRPARMPSTRPKALVSRSKVEAAAPQSLEPASSHVNLFRGWLLLVLPLSFVFALGLLLPTLAIAGRSLRARVRSKGLSDRRPGANGSDGIRYRE